MLEALQVRNFQCHSKLSIEFDEHVTTIIGPSDVGKSSVIRALRWACTNNPSGDAFIQDGKTRCGVRLKVDGKAVERMKGVGENDYKLSGKAYKSFGANVPEPIANFLNLSPVTWQGQHDSPFWLAETAGQVARELNAVVNLESIDVALQSVNKMVAKGRARQDVATERLRDTQERLEGLGWVEEARDDMGELEAAHSQYEGTSASFARLYSLYAEAFQEQLQLDLMQRAWQVASGVESYGAAAVASQDAVDRLSGIIEEVEGLPDTEAPDMLGVDIAFEKMEQAQMDFRELQVTVLRCKEVRQFRVRGVAAALEAAAELAEELEGRCPLCGAETGDLT